METVIFTTVACLLVIIIGLAIYLFNKDRAQKLKPLKEAYEKALSSGNKSEALKLGRQYFAAARNGRLTIYDEQRLSNDIAAMITN